MGKKAIKITPGVQCMNKVCGLFASVQQPAHTDRKQSGSMLCWGIVGPLKQKLFSLQTHSKVLRRSPWAQVVLQGKHF